MTMSIHFPLYLNPGYYVEYGVYWILTLVFLGLRIYQFKLLWPYIMAKQVMSVSRRVLYGQLALTVILVLQILLSVDMHEFFGIYKNPYLPWILSLLVTFTEYAYVFYYIYYASKSHYILVNNIAFPSWIQYGYCTAVFLLLSLACGGFIASSVFDQTRYLVYSYSAAAIVFSTFGTFYIYFVFSYRFMLLSSQLPARFSAYYGKRQSAFARKSSSKNTTTDSESSSSRSSEEYSITIDTFKNNESEHVSFDNSETGIAKFNSPIIPSSIATPRMLSRNHCELNMSSFTPKLTRNLSNASFAPFTYTPGANKLSLSPSIEKNEPAFSSPAINNSSPIIEERSVEDQPVVMLPKLPTLQTTDNRASVSVLSKFPSPKFQHRLTNVSKHSPYAGLRRSISTGFSSPNFKARTDSAASKPSITTLSSPGLKFFRNESKSNVGTPDTRKHRRSSLSSCPSSAHRVSDVSDRSLTPTVSPFQLPGLRTERRSSLPSIPEARPCIYKRKMSGTLSMNGSTQTEKDSEVVKQLTLIGLFALLLMAFGFGYYILRIVFHVETTLTSRVTLNPKYYDWLDNVSYWLQWFVVILIYRTARVPKFQNL